MNKNKLELQSISLISKIFKSTKLNKGEEALILLKILENDYKETKNFLLNGPGCYIEIGYVLKDENLINKGISLGIKTLSSINKDKDYKHYSLLCYNIGNGYYDLYINNKNKLENYNNDFLQKAKYYYRNIIKTKNFDTNIYKHTLVNLANIYKNLGRIVESIHAYENVLKIDPVFSMAKMNLGDSLITFANICGIYKVATYKEAYNLINEGLTDTEGILEAGGINALNNFKYKKSKIESLFKDKTILKNKSTHPEIILKKITKFEKEYYKFCIKNKLFLNFHIHKSNIICKASIIDNINLSMIHKVKEKNKIFFYTKYLNQIKEDYSTARFLLFQSQYNLTYINRISSLTKYIDTLDYSNNNLYIGLLKSAYKESFNILDKIAMFLNSYLNLNLQKDKIYFQTIWCVKDKNGNFILRKEIINLKNINLFGLYDVYIDFQNKSYKHLKDIRNAATHDKLVIYDLFTKDIQNYSEREELSLSYNNMIDYTIELMLIIKSSIINLINFVNTEENKKYKNTNNIAPLYFFEKKQYFMKI